MSSNKTAETISEEELYDTLWLSPICGMPSEDKYGKEGYFLARDGSLLFVNIFSMTGDKWSVEGNSLLLYSHTERYPEPLPMVYPLRRVDGVVGVTPVKGELEMLPPRGLKMSAETPEGRWLISNMLNPENAQPSPEQPVYIEIIQSDIGAVQIIGNGGVNNFRAVLDLDGFKWNGGPYMRTLMAGPGLEYENLLMNSLDRVSRYLKVNDYLFLYEETELIMVLSKDRN